MVNTEHDVLMRFILLIIRTGVTEVDPDLDILYKQWFDNVEEYFERKRQREQSNKNKKQKREETTKPHRDVSAEESLEALKA